MLELKPTTEQDLKVAASIERKRRLEEERKARIFNPRVRKIGIDKEYLDKQIEEKLRQRDIEKQEENSLDEALVRCSRLALTLQLQAEQEKRKENQKVNEYRRKYQRPELRRDFDLYDPELLKKSKPPRLNDDDDIGLSSAQKFEGEDLNQENRTKEQREQMQSWIEQQMCEKDQALKRTQQDEKSYYDFFMGINKRAAALENMEHECRRKLNEATAKFNLALAEERERKRRTLQMQEDEDKRVDIYNHVTGDFLTESKNQAASHLGPSRPLTSRFKGMSLDELKQIRDDQESQMQEIQRMRAEDKAKNEQWDRLMKSNANAAEIYYRELEKRKAELSKKIAEENLQLAQEQKSKQEYLNQHVYKNKPSSEFYKQFNTSTR